MEHFIGDPDFQMDFWQPQDMSDNCAVAAQTSIINQYLDVPISLAEANYTAFSNGFYTPGAGTSPQDAGALFDYYGIPSHTVEHATIQDLAAELQQGHRVVVGVNSAELWDQGPMAEFWNWTTEAFGLDTSAFNPADHALVVTGVDVSDPAHPQVLVNDSGDPDGAAKAYPPDRFMDSWQNSDFHYVATSAPPPGGAALEIDLADILGFGTGMAAGYLGIPIPTAAAAGTLVESVARNLDWDQVLATI